MFYLRSVSFMSSSDLLFDLTLAGVTEREVLPTSHQTGYLGLNLWSSNSALATPLLYYLNSH